MNLKANNIPPRAPIMQKGSTVANNLFCKTEVSSSKDSKTAFVEYFIA